MLTPKQANERVAAGIAVLNKKWRRKTPWREVVNLKNLDISYSGECILGQLYGNFLATGAQRIASTPEIGLQYGFEILCTNPNAMLPIAEWEKDCKVLTNAWKRAIRKLRKEASK